MKAKKPIKSPGKFAKSSGYIAAIFFSLYAFVLALVDVLWIFIYKANITPDSWLLVLTAIAMAVLLVFKKANFTFIPSLVLGCLFVYNMIAYFVRIFSNGARFSIGSVFYVLECLPAIIGMFLYAILCIIAFNKASRKATVVWFIPSIFIFLSSIIGIVNTLVSIIIPLGQMLDGYYPTDLFFSNLFMSHIPDFINSVLLVAGFVFAGLAVRAHAKQQLFDAQQDAATKDEIIG